MHEEITPSFSENPNRRKYKKRSNTQAPNMFDSLGSASDD